ncbi:MAG: A/G-specific adenine glycosylase [Candidatus Latescibacterota bacterium]|nr:MAG: A/G-specific adenine glycosylase [Candidatus Latescibacterota bacterium]
MSATLLTPRARSAFQNRLRHWFEQNSRDLPWRHTNDPYLIWVSEVMLQQTQVKTVIPYFQKFVAEYPDILTLANASLNDVLRHWEKMGYYSRARNLHTAARQLVRDADGVVPPDYPSFRKLPGVGDYIASAVLSIAFGQPHAVVDGNTKRVLSRLFLIDAPANHSSSTAVFKKLAEEILDHGDPGLFNQAMMELGATVCKPRNPACDECPVKKHCKAFRAGQQDEYPIRIERRKTPKYHIAVGVVYKGDKILITRRKEKGLLGGLWEFPGGKVRKEESAAEACKREIEEEVNLDVEVTDHVTHVDHAYSHFKIGVDVFACRYLAGKVKLNGPIDHRWILVEDTAHYPFPAVNHKIFPHLKIRDVSRQTEKQKGRDAGSLTGCKNTRDS